ncbi:MAG: hypothetical protein ACJA0T_000440 [Colwellia sp.]|jgi:hypothetical protein
MPLPQVLAYKLSDKSTEFTQVYSSKNKLFKNAFSGTDRNSVTANVEH